MNTTIALMYHALGVTAGPGVDPHYAVDMPRFEQHLSLCVQLAGGAISARDWLDGCTGTILTFDDGHESNYRHGFPALRARQATADFFVNPAQVGTRGFATWAQLREMANGGMSIQSHGYDHRRYLTELSPRALREDLRRARSEIEDRIGHPVTLLSPPGGRSPLDLERAAVEAGYARICNSKPSTIRRSASRTLGRFAVTSKLDARTLELWIRGGRGLLRAKMRYSALGVAKWVLGDRSYESVRGRLLRTSVSPAAPPD
jgi:hypothetical protein